MALNILPISFDQQKNPKDRYDSSHLTDEKMC